MPVTGWPLELTDLADTGVTYRQIDYWIRRGWLHPEHAGGSGGEPRRWSTTERAVAKLMARLVAAGVTPERAATLARRAVRNSEDDTALIDLGPGLGLLIEVP